MPSRALVLAVLLAAFIAHPASPAAPLSRLDAIARAIGHAPTGPFGNTPERPLIAPDAIGPFEPSTLPGSWSRDFALPGLDGTPLAALYYHGDLVLAGEFRAAGGQPVHGIARWDGHAWHSMGSVNAYPVLTLAEWRGRLVAGGGFGGLSHLPGVLAAWNGSSWDPIGGDITGTITSLATADSSLIVQGDITLGDGGGPHHVARWTGAAWDSLGGGVDGYASIVTPYLDGFVVGGQFQHAGGVAARNVAFWHAGQWSPLGSGVGTRGDSPVVFALAALGNDLLASGVFEDAGAVSLSDFARWNGSAWSRVPGADLALKVYTMTNVGDRIALGGWGHPVPAFSFFVGFWDGQSFAIDSVRIDYPPTVFAGTPGVLAAGGFFTRVNGADMPFVAIRANDVWRAANEWHAGMHGLAGHATALAEYRGSVFALGDFAYAADDTGWVATPSVARWDGARWRPAGQLDAAAEGTLQVLGDSLYAAYGRVRRWNGSEWASFGTPQDVGIVRLERFAGSFWGLSQCGYDCSGMGFAGLYRLVDGVWTRVSPPADLDSTTAAPTASHVSGGTMYVAWATSSAYDAPSRVYAFDGQHWGTSLGEFENGAVRDLAVFRGQLCATGYFNDVNGVEMPCFAMRTPAGWSAMGNPGLMRGPMAASDSLLFVGGYAVWTFDGATWSSLALDLAGTTTSLLLTDRALWAGGWFRSSGEAPSEGVARFDLGRAPTVPALSHVVAAPNPSRDAVALQFTLARAGRVRVTILDLSGRRVATPVDGFIVAGAHTLTWSGRDDHGRSLPAGLYFARVEPEGVAANTQRIVRVP